MPVMGEMDKIMSQAEMLPASEVNSQLDQIVTPVIVPDISSLSVVDSAPGYCVSNSCSLSNMTDQILILTRK